MLREIRKIRISSLCISLLSLALALALSACGSNNGTATVTSVTISPTAATADLNTSITLVAVVNLSNTTVTTNTAVTWQVNGVGGGNSQVGTIVNSPDDIQEGIYTAPTVAPTTNNGQVMITATAPQVPSSTTNTSIVTSNVAIITVGVGQGLAVTPTTATVPAGGTFQFSALLNNLVDSSATWAVSSTSGGNIGAINPTTGLYTAPPSPPPGATITVTATDSTLTPAVTATATATIVYSDLSLSGQFAFSYSGNDQNGFLSVAGSFATDGAGHVTSGIEDVDSFSTNGWTQYQIPPNTSTYKVGTDGRGTILLNPGIPGTATLQFALTSNQHAMVIRFDRSFTGSGTIDQQNLNDTSDLSAITGPYVFSGLGADSAFSPLGIAGKFTASGNSTNQTGTGVVDVNDNGATTQATSLNVSYALDSNAPDTGRGKMTINSAATGQRQFAFYIVDATHLYFVEIDNASAGYLQGNMYSGAAGTSFSAANLATGNYAFTFGGNSPTGAFAAGGVFASGGNGNITGGVFDSNNAGTVTSDATLGTCAYTVDPSTGRVLLGLCPGSNTLQFAAYQTAQASSTAVEPTLVMLELDPTAVSIGSGYSQKTVTQFAAGSFALFLGGQGVFHDNSAAIQQDVSGQATLSASEVSNGNLDINNFNSVFQTDPISAADSSILAPDSNGRGTATIVVSNPNSSYSLAYYLIDANTALLFDADSSNVLIGTVARQF
jgi:hypothetical protein